MTQAIGEQRFERRYAALYVCAAPRGAASGGGALAVAWCGQVSRRATDARRVENTSLLRACSQAARGASALFPIHLPSHARSQKIITSSAWSCTARHQLISRTTDQLTVVRVGAPCARSADQLSSWSAGDASNKDSPMK